MKLMSRCIKQAKEIGFGRENGTFYNGQWKQSRIKVYNFGITCVLTVNQPFCENICRYLVRVVSVLILPLTSDQIQEIKGENIQLLGLYSRVSV